MDERPDRLASRQKDSSSIRDFLSKLPSYKDLHQIVTEIELLIRTFDPLDLIASLAFENLSYSTGSNPPDDGGQAFVEYIALLCLKSGLVRGSNRSIPPNVIGELQENIRKLFSVVGLRRGLEREASSSLERTRQYAELMFLSVRNLDDFDHLEQMLGGLFPKHRDSLLDTYLGFSAHAATRLAKAIGDLLAEKLALRQLQGQELIGKLITAINNGSPDVPAGLKPLLDQITNEKEQHDLLLAYAAQQTFASFADVYTVQVPEVAQSLSISEDETRRLLEASSMTFGEVDASFSLPMSTHDFLFRSIIKSERGYFCPIPDLLLWSVRPRLEELLKKDATVWEAYQKHRATFLVDQGAALFEQILVSTTILKGLKYRSDQLSDEHTRQEYELDLAILFNGIVFLVECKGGTLPVKARSGKSRPSRDAVQDLILDPSSQLDRARRYIETSQNAGFELPSGISVVISRDTIEQLFLVALTLEDVNLFAANPQNVPVLENHPEATIPWIVNLLTLQSIAHFIQFPAEFVHYLSRRLRLNTIKKVSAVEELDYFGNYLSSGLYFDDAEIGQYTDVALDGYTEPIEAYRRYEMGRSDIPVQKPRQKLPPELATILGDLQKINSQTALQVSLLLLEMSGKARAQVAQAIGACRRKAEQDGKLHDFSTLSKTGEVGLTFMSSKLPSKDLLSRLTTFCRWKIEQTGAKRWGGIASVAGQDGVAHECIFVTREFTRLR
jgi:hypothetical protein